jgi:hypothetical protein
MEQTPEPIRRTPLYIAVPVQNPDGNQTLNPQSFFHLSPSDNQYSARTNSQAPEKTNDPRYNRRLYPALP